MVRPETMWITELQTQIDQSFKRVVSWSEEKGQRFPSNLTCQPITVWGMRSSPWTPLPLLSYSSNMLCATNYFSMNVQTQNRSLWPALCSSIKILKAWAASVVVFDDRLSYCCSLLFWICSFVVASTPRLSCSFEIGTSIPLFYFSDYLSLSEIVLNKQVKNSRHFFNSDMCCSSEYQRLMAIKLLSFHWPSSQVTLLPHWLVSIRQSASKWNSGQKKVTVWT